MHVEAKGGRICWEVRRLLLLGYSIFFRNHPDGLVGNRGEAGISRSWVRLLRNVKTRTDGAAPLRQKTYHIVVLGS